MAKNVGIHAIQVYFPRLFVDLSEMEEHQSCQGKLTKGLGLKEMGVCAACEDINSISLTVVSQLLKATKISPQQVGFLEVGTETLIDKSKAVKTTLMRLFPNNSNIAGIDTKNACFGCTAALFNAINWMESSYWDGRLALVVGADIAAYRETAARPTAGCGAVAILIGPDASFVFDQGLRAHHMEDSLDFYKPEPHSHYPVVHGPASVACYMRAVDRCHAAYLAKGSPGHSLLDVHYWCFHAPFSRLVEKAAARVLCLELRRLGSAGLKAAAPALKSHLVDHLWELIEHLDPEDSRQDKAVEVCAVKCAEPLLECRVEPTLMMSRRVGNMYTASLFAGFASLLACQSAAELAGRRVSFFSYGSGLASAMFSGRFSENSQLCQSMMNMSSAAELLPRLNARQRLTVSDWENALQVQESLYLRCDYQPIVDLRHLWPDTFYLTDVGSQFQRSYAVTDIDCYPVCHTDVIPSIDD